MSEWQRVTRIPIRVPRRQLNGFRYVCGYTKAVKCHFAPWLVHSILLLHVADTSYAISAIRISLPRPTVARQSFCVKPKSVAIRGEKPLNCQVKDELVNHLIALNNKLNLLSPDLVQSEEERAAVEEQRGNLYADIKRHRAKGHDGKPCPAARYTRY